VNGRVHHHDVEAGHPFQKKKKISEITHMAIGIESELRFLYSTLVIMHVFSLLNNICNNPIR
jgi:hypothetical protein